MAGPDSGSPSPVGLMQLAAPLLQRAIGGPNDVTKGLWRVLRPAAQQYLNIVQGAQAGTPRPPSGPMNTGGTPPLLPGPVNAPPMTTPGVPPWLALPVLWTVIGETTSEVAKKYESPEDRWNRQQKELEKKRAAEAKKRAALEKKQRAAQAKKDAAYKKKIDEAKRRAAIILQRQARGGSESGRGGRRGAYFPPGASSPPGGGTPGTAPGAPSVNVTVNIPSAPSSSSAPKRPPRADAGLSVPKIYRRPLPVPAPLPPTPSPFAKYAPLLLPSVLPALSSLLRTRPGSKRTGARDPLTVINNPPVASSYPMGFASSSFGGFPPTPTKTKACSCGPKKKRGPRKRRTVCYKGSYVERASGITKRKREEVPCQA